jgi:hypothetical protein
MAASQKALSAGLPTSKGAVMGGGCLCRPAEQIIEQLMQLKEET